MKGLVNCNFLPGSARRLELGTVSAEPLSRRSAKRLACRACVLLAKVPIALKRAVGLSGPSSSRQSAPILQQWSEQVCRSFEAGQAILSSLPGNTGRYGYRKVAELLRQAGWIINDKRVERIWQREGLPISSPSAAGPGWSTDRAFGCGRSTAIMSGPTTLSRTAPTMDASIGCSTGVGS
jgi:HTH-like domain